MHAGRRLIAFVALLAGPALANPAADRTTIEAGEKAWGNSFVTGDAATVDRLLADDFTGTGPDGILYDKPTMLGWLRAGASMRANRTTVVKLRIFGDIAVVNGRDDYVSISRGPNANAWTDIWARRAGRWRIISAQDTHIAR